MVVNSRETGRRVASGRGQRAGTTGGRAGERADEQQLAGRVRKVGARVDAVSLTRGHWASAHLKYAPAGIGTTYYRCRAWQSHVRVDRERL